MCPRRRRRARRPPSSWESCTTCARPSRARSSLRPHRCALPLFLCCRRGDGCSSARPDKGSRISWHEDILEGFYDGSRVGSTHTCQCMSCTCKHSLPGVATVELSGNAGLPDGELPADEQGPLLHPGADGAADLPDGRRPQPRRAAAARPAQAHGAVDRQAGLLHARAAQQPGQVRLPLLKKLKCPSPAAQLPLISGMAGAMVQESSRCR